MTANDIHLTLVYTGDYSLQWTELSMQGTEVAPVCRGTLGGAVGVGSGDIGTGRVSGPHTHSAAALSEGIAQYQAGGRQALLEQVGRERTKAGCKSWSGMIKIE
jgi:hypothetical protein